MKKVIVFSLTIMMIFNMSIIGFAEDKNQQPQNDISGHWAYDVTSKWMKEDLIKGYPDGTFRPDNKITKAEFITLINRLYGFHEKSEKNYEDVDENHWFKEQTLIAKKNQYMDWHKNDDLKPNKNITRQEVSAIIASIYSLDATENLSAIQNFNDKDHIPDWSRGYIDAVVHKGYVKGYQDNTLRAEGEITRAEAVTLLDRVVGEIVREEGIYGPKEDVQTISSNLTINAENVTLQNTIIKGDLILAAGIKEGDVQLKNVTVEGNTIINGGGENSITITNCQMGEIVVFKANGKIRIVSANSQIGETILQSSAKLEGKFKNIEIVKQGKQIKLEGDYEEVVVETQTEISVTGDTQIKQLTVEQKAKNTSINMEKNTEIKEADFKAKTSVTGKGKIKKAILQSNGITVETPVEEKETKNQADDSGVKKEKKTKKSSGSSDTKAPKAIAYTPADDTNGIAMNTNLTVEFDETIKKGTGIIEIKKAIDDSIVRTFSAIDTEITIDDTKAKIEIGEDLEENTAYYIHIEAGVFKDKKNNNYAGIQDKTTWNFKTIDRDAPVATSFMPEDDSNGVAIDSNLTITFNETVKKGTGYITIKQVKDDMTVRTVSTISTEVTINDNQVVINSESDLSANTKYYINIEEGAFIDSEDNPYAGIQNKTTWNFETVDTKAPTVESYSPADNATKAAINSDLVITFNESVVKGTTGNIILKKSNDDIVETISVTSSAVSINGTTLTINPTYDLDSITSYYIKIDEGAINDLSGNPYEGIQYSETWNFKTEIQIRCIEDLASIGRREGWELDEHYTLAKNLDFQSDASYENKDDTTYGDINGDGQTNGIKQELTTGKGWKPIGEDYYNSFKGTLKGLKGSNYEIRNLLINRPDNDYVGLFGYVSEANIENLGLKDMNITGKNYVGGLIGGSDGTDVINCYAEGDISGEDYVGGLIGSSDGTDVINSHAGGNVEGKDGLGGLIGNIWSSKDVTINNCYATAKITGEDRMGGLVGNANGSDDVSIVIKMSYATGDVTGVDYLGGFVGDTSENCMITNVYASGKVTGRGYLGGLIGSNTSTITNAYATGKVTGEGAFLGGLVGSDRNGKIINCYAIGSVIGNESAVGGLVGIMEKDTLKHSIAFNRTVKGGWCVGRVVGDVREEAIYLNNYAYKSMEVNDTTITDADSEPENTPNGKGVKEDDFRNSKSENSPYSHWEFDSDENGDLSYWKVETEGARPVLYVDPDDNGAFEGLEPSEGSSIWSD